MGVASAYAVLSLFALGVAGADSHVRERPVRATAAIEIRPVGDGDWLAWAQAPRTRPKAFSVLAREGRGRPFRVNPPGTQALPGGIWRRFLVYEERRGRGDWNIVLYDLARRKRLRAPAGVNTKADETRPSLSGAWLLFTRYSGQTRGKRGLVRVLLRNVRTAEQIELDRVTVPPPVGPTFDPRERVSSWQVNGRYAIATACVGCGRRLYDIAERRMMELPLGIPDTTVHPVAVSRSGTVYFARSVTFGYCEYSVQIFSRAPGARYFVLLATVPRGIGVGSIYVVSRSGGRTTVYYTRGYLCGRNPDAYALEVSETSGGDGAGAG